MPSSTYDKQEISNKIIERTLNQFQQHTARSWQRVRHVFISTIMKYFDEKNTDMYHMEYIKTPRHHTYSTFYWNEIWKSLLMNKVPQLQSSPSNVQHHFHLTYICCYAVICVGYQSTIIYLNDTGPIHWCLLHPTISKKSVTVSVSVKWFSSTQLPATYSPELTTCTTRIHLHHETCWWRTQWHVLYQIYQNATSSHVSHTQLRWKMELVVDEESTSTQVTSQQYSKSVQPNLHLLLWNDMSEVSRYNDIFTWYRSYSLMFSSPYEYQEISNKTMGRILDQSSDSAPFNFHQHTAQRWKRVRHVFLSIMKHADGEHTDMYHMKYIKTHVTTYIPHSIEMKNGTRCWWRKYLSTSHLQVTFNISSTLPTIAAMKWYEWSIKTT